MALVSRARRRPSIEFDDELTTTVRKVLFKAQRRQREIGAESDATALELEVEAELGDTLPQLFWPPRRRSRAETQQALREFGGPLGDSAEGVADILHAALDSKPPMHAIIESVVALIQDENGKAPFYTDADLDASTRALERLAPEVLVHKLSQEPDEKELRSWSRISELYWDLNHVHSQQHADVFLDAACVQRELRDTRDTPKRGRPLKVPGQKRGGRVDARVALKTKERLRKAGIGGGEALDLVAELVDLGLTLEDIRQRCTQVE